MDTCSHCCGYGVTRSVAGRLPSKLSENLAKAATYTVIVFASLVMALRPAWRRLRLWIDLLGLFVLHIALVLPLLRLLDSHSIRLNWAVALPFVAIELLLFLGLLWRRNVGDSSP